MADGILSASPGGVDQLCSKCGAILPARSQFCPRCGAASVTPGPAATQRNALLIGIPVALILLALIGWALLAGLPFSKDKTLSRTERPAPAVVTEETGNTATASQIGDGVEPPAPSPDFQTTTTAMPPQQQQPPVPAPVPAAAPVPEPSLRTANSEITESQAEDILRGYLASRDYYHVGAECTGVASQGFKNGGYTINVVDRCGDRGRVGRWRVDAFTGEMFVQKGDGRYLSP